MFTLKHTITSAVLLMALCTTCAFPDKQAEKDNDVIAVSKGSDSPGPKDFLDSVLAKKGFTFSEINQHVDIDSIYFRNRVRFVGDTVLYRHSKHPLAIIRCGKGTINKKLLFVFNKKGDCTASLVVGMEGDVDAYDSIVLSYKILGKNSFSTTEVWTYHGGNKEDKVTVTKQFYAINKKGRIMAQDNIIRSFTNPKAFAVTHRQ